MRYVFGPVSSRRFGLSLGIDLSYDKKRCNFDCLYCELDKSEVVDIYDNPPSVDFIINDVENALKKYTFDVLTITSNGEPTLYPYLDELVNRLKKYNKKLLILSNSSTIDKKSVQNTLSKLDIVKLSLDSVDEKTFKKIDRPSKSVNLNKIINSLIDFSKDYKGKLVIEVLVVHGINDKEDEFIKLNEVLKKINPYRVDISTIDRPPAYDVKPVSINKLFQLSKLIENQNVFIATRNNLRYIQETFTEEELLTTLSKRPFSSSDVEYLLDDITKKIFYNLLDKNKIIEYDVLGLKFYKVNR